MKPKYYVLFVRNDIEPELHGPFSRATIRDNRAKALKVEHGNDHGVFPLNVNARGLPKIGAYSGGFFMEEET